MIYKTKDELRRHFRNEHDAIPSRKTVNEWLSRTQPKARGKYDASLIEAYLMTVKSPFSPDNRGLDVTAIDVQKDLLGQKLEEEVLHLRARRMQEEIKLAEQRKELIKYEDALRAQNRIAVEVKQHLLAIPRSNADRLAHLEASEVEAVLSEIIFDCLTALSKRGQAESNGASSSTAP